MGQHLRRRLFSALLGGALAVGVPYVVATQRANATTSCAKLTLYQPSMTAVSVGDANCTMSPGRTCTSLNMFPAARVDGCAAVPTAP